jgi:hypothetical protein
MPTAIFFVLVIRNPSVSAFGEPNVALANLYRTADADYQRLDVPMRLSR